MSRNRFLGWAAVASTAVALSFLQFQLNAQNETSAVAGGEFARQDPAKIVAATTCGECHVSEFEVWKRTPHSTSFKTLHRKESAEAIAGKMGFRLIKRQSLCLSCHYTAVVEREQLRAGSGVSCESCHGAARDWLDVHNNYGSGADYGSETAEHRQKRIEDSRRAGMRRPSDLYDTVASCYGCHTVPEEELVNVGGHSTGSATFELVAWQEKIRHNFLQSFLTGDGSENAVRPQEDLRRAYVVGRALDLEFSLRGMAEATGKGVYTKAMSRRVRTSLSELRAIASEATLVEVEEMVATVRAVEVIPNNRQALLEAADKIEAATRRFLEKQDGTQLASLDGLMSGEGGSQVADLEEDGEPDTEEEDTESPQLAATTDQAGNPNPPAGGTTADGASAAPARPQVVGKRKNRIRPKSRHATIGPGSCSGCHGPQNGWWYEDPHFAAADPFFDQRPKNVQIARLYGLSPGKMARGNQICMDCHGSVVTGRESREVQDGVGCESCHGPAKEWLEPHQEGDESLGPQRPGYVAALKLGKLDLPDLKVRAKVCSGCHYITDSRLISSGHPSGKGFDYAAGMAQVRHWEKPLASSSSLQAAFSTALSARGAVPDVPIATWAQAPPGGAGGGGSGARLGEAADSYLAQSTEASYRRRPPRPRGAGGGRTRGSSAASRSSRAPVDLNLPPFPEIAESTPVEEVLRHLKERLEALYRALGRSAEGEP
ncbi:MAG: cytochrome c family protein [Deltaproteobacteria bacterium]|nr:cytochrome c family protein [Deltaproteobacteria bacterium]